MQLMFFTLLGGSWFRELKFFWQIPAHLVFDDLLQGDIGHAQAGVLGERPAAAAGPGVELADAPGDQIDQHIWIDHFCQCLFTEFAIQGCPSF